MPSNDEITERLKLITAPWNGKQYGPPWEILLAVQPWRIGEQGNVSAQTIQVSLIKTWEANWTQEKVRLCATPIATSIYRSRPKESTAYLKFGGHSNWPLSVTLASALDAEIPLSITYDIDWEIATDRQRGLGRSSKQQLLSMPYLRLQHSRDQKLHGKISLLKTMIRFELS
jgi:hypothetical protein